MSGKRSSSLDLLGLKMDEENQRTASQQQSRLPSPVVSDDEDTHPKPKTNKISTSGAQRGGVYQIVAQTPEAPWLKGGKEIENFLIKYEIYTKARKWTKTEKKDKIHLYVCSELKGAMVKEGRGIIIDEKKQNENIDNALYSTVQTSFNHLWLWYLFASHRRSIEVVHMM